MRWIMMMGLCISLLWGREEGDRINAVLRSVGADESIHDSATLRFALEKHRGVMPTMQRRYRLTQNELARVERKFTQAGVPKIFALIPYAESHYNPKSRGYGTAGLWQFSPASARRFNLKVGQGIDERLDVDRSTDAAIAYLKYLKKEFGSWYLADLAFGMGEGTLRELIRRNGGSKKIAVLMSDPRFPRGTKAHFSTIVLLKASIGNRNHEIETLLDQNYSEENVTIP